MKNPKKIVFCDMNCKSCTNNTHDFHKNCDKNDPKKCAEHRKDGSCMLIKGIRNTGGSNVRC